jgi:hypothetical protein
MSKKEIKEAILKLFKPANEGTEDVFYNAGVIDAVKAVEKLAGESSITGAFD